MEKFTASEVRAEAHRHANEVEDMLNAFADLLEAQEKAVPVYQHRSKNGPMLRWFDCSEETFMAMEHNEHDREHFDRRILYTHPAPADAERLSEALQPFANLLQPHHASMPDDRPIYGINKAEITAGDLRRANEALAAHSAQAQPPANLEKMPRMEQLRRFVEWERANNPERTHIAEWALRRIAYLEAQPPAASVPGVSAQAHEKAQAALAAQESPNG